MTMTDAKGTHRTNNELEAGFDRRVQLLVRCMQERHLLLAATHCCFELPTSEGSEALTSQHSYPSKAPSGNIAGSPEAQQLQSQLKMMIDSLSHVSKQLPTDGEGHRCDDDMSHIIAILRHVSLRTLLSALGWYASESEIEKAVMESKKFLHQEAALSRLCLRRAAAIFGRLRPKRHFSCYDPLSLMVSVLYIHLFDQLSPKTGTTHPHDGVNGCEAPPIRLDRAMSEQALRVWVQNSGSEAVHITGIGLLQTHGSSQRIWNEFRRIMRSSTAWWTLCQSLELAIKSCTDGNRPTFWDESSLTVP